LTQDKCPCALCSATITLIWSFREALCQKLHGFYGIIIKIFFGDHPPPHFHAVYGEYNALIGIESLEIIEGDLPNRAQKLVGNRMGYVVSARTARYVE
jgi:Domain of unknown function (DUF4160)